MNEGPNSPAIAPEAPPRVGGFWVARLLVAWVVTLGALLYAWGRVLVASMLVGRPEAWPSALLGLGLLAVLALTVSLAGRWHSFRLHRLVAGGVLLSWLLAGAVLIGLYGGGRAPRLAVIALFVLATVWVVWLAWLPCWPLRWRGRLTVLVLLLGGVAGFPLLLRAEGLTGDSRVEFAWRWRPDANRVPAVAAEADTPVHLAPPGPDDYPQFLGPDRLATLPQARLVRDWGASPPQLLWRRPVGAGWGAFAVAGGYAFTQEQRGGQECVTCYRAEDGTDVWVHADPVLYEASMGGPGPRATPTVADGRVYAVGATGLLNCLDAASGRRLWSVNVQDDNRADNLPHGVCASPLVLGDVVVVCPTGNGGPSLAAYDRTTGARVWAGGGDRAGYSSPELAVLGGVRQILLFNESAVAGHDAATGEVLWRFPWVNDTRTNVAQPVPNVGGPDRVFVSTGYGKGCALFEVKRASGGAWSAEAVWQSRELRTKFTTAVVRAGYAYGLDDGILACVDLATGRRRWKEGRYGHGQVLLAGDLLLVQAEDGAVVLVEASPERPRELGRIEALSGKTWNHPALAGRLLLVRNDREAACYALPVESPP
jgi:outer membrane protein assembly factor BamB